MRKFLVALFAVLIMGLGIYGYTTSDDPVEIMDQEQEQSNIIEFDG